MNIKYFKENKKHSAGFSAIEIIAVILIVAVVGVIAVSRFTSTTPYKVSSETEILKAHLRYAQFRALSAADTAYGINNTTWGISISANSYTLQKDRVDAAGIPLTGDVTIIITDGASPRTITVTQNTGFIP